MTTTGEDPDQEALATLFTAVLERDPTAPARLASLLIPTLQKRFSGRPANPPVESTIGEVVAQLLSDPAGSGYDSQRGPLVPFLYRKVDWRLHDERRSESRHGSRRAEYGENVFAIRTDESYLPIDEHVAERLSPGNASPSEIAAALESVREWSEEDRQVAQLIADGERKTEVYARSMGIDHLAKSEQEKLVKRSKDRIAARFKKMRSQQ